MWHCKIKKENKTKQINKLYFESRSTPRLLLYKSAAAADQIGSALTTAIVSSYLYRKSAWQNIHVLGEKLVRVDPASKKKPASGPDKYHKEEVGRNVDLASYTSEPGVARCVRPRSLISLVLPGQGD